MAEKLSESELDDHQCDICLSTQETSPATHKCIQCEEYMCSACTKVHKGSKLSKSHLLVTTEEIAAGKLDQLSVACPKYCEIHPTEEIKFYCNTCNVSSCRDCIIIKHIQHTCIDIDQAFKSIFPKTIQNLNDKIDFETCWLNQLQKQQKTTEENRDDLKRRIRENADLLVDRVDNHYNNELQMLSKELDNTTGQLKTFKSIQQNSENVLKHGHNSHKVQLCDEVSVKLSEYEKSVAHRHYTTIDMTFTALYTGLYSVTVADPVNMNIVKLTAEIDVRVEGDTVTPDITGIAVHPVTGDIIVADNNNHKQKTFTRAGTLKSQVSKGEGYQLKQLLDVTVLHNGNIAVTNCNWIVGEVLVLSPDYKMISKFTSSDCSGMAELCDGTLAICSRTCMFTSYTRVEFKAVDGTTVRPPLEFDNLKFPNYVAVTPDDGLIISDRDSHNIQISDKKKVLVFQYGEQGSGDGQLNHPRGVCIDKLGNIIAADQGNNRLQVLSLQGKFIRNLITGDHGLCKPRAVAINRDEQIFVSESDNSTIKVFKCYPIISIYFNH